VATYMRAVLRLVREPVPAHTPDAARAVAARMGSSPDGFLEVWQARESPASFVPGDACTDGVIELVLAIASYVDTLEGR
jgi:hypothetical protein